jgi:hypothetical protein
MSKLAEPLKDAHGTLGFRGTPVEKHWIREKKRKTAKTSSNFNLTKNAVMLFCLAFRFVGKTR